MEMKIQLSHCQYPIIIEAQMKNQIGQLIRKIAQQKIAIVTDETVWELHGQHLMDQLSEFETELTVIKPGEASKSAENLMGLYQKWIAAGLSRQDLVIAFGGGVVGDLTGYAAATYLRGVPYVQIPTTLLSQIDSSIGGKVAIDLPEGKNLVGTFYHPQAVFIDPSYLETLELRILKDGIAEAVKSGCIKDASLIELLEHTQLPLKEEVAVAIIEKSLNVKKALVEQDEKEAHVRKLLNFGHTLGHALETYGQYKHWTHGEAVAIGMIAVTKATEALGLTTKGTVDRLIFLHQKLGIPYTYDVSLDQLIPLMMRDKKKAAGKLDLAVIESIGESYILPVQTKELKNFFLKGV